MPRTPTPRTRRLRRLASRPARSGRGAPRSPWSAVRRPAARRPARREHAVPLELYRIDDRLIHGQVVVGWGRPLDIRFIVLVDDEVAASEWEQELYRMGVPPEMEVFFH